MSTACTWASARGEPAKQPPRQAARPPTHPPASELGGKGWAQAAQIPGRGPHWGARQDTHPAKPRHSQPRTCQAALLLSVGSRAGHSSRAFWGQQRHWPVSHRTGTDTHSTPRHTGTCLCVTPVHTHGTQRTGQVSSIKVGNPGPRHLNLWWGARMRPGAHPIPTPPVTTGPAPGPMNSICQVPVGREAGKAGSGLWPFPPSLIYPITQLCIPMPGPLLRSWGAHR